MDPSKFFNSVAPLPAPTTLSTDSARHDSLGGESSSSGSGSSNSSSNGDYDGDVEKYALLLEHDRSREHTDQPRKLRSSNNQQFLIWTAVNTFATIGIVFTNKAIFADPQLRINQSSFAAFHFVVTGCTLYFLSQPPFSMFEPVRAKLLDMMPLALSMCMNVILPNLSLAYSSVAFYQIVRVLLTPTVALINFMLSGTKIPRQAVYALIPVCLGVAIVTYYDTQAQTGANNTPVKTTSPPGVFFAFAGVLASSLYTVWIGSYQKAFGMNSFQLLLNQAPTSAFLLLYVIPFTDRMPYWDQIEEYRYWLIALSGIFAALINISQFFIVAGAGPVSSTVVGHLKTCSIVALGWMISGRRATDKCIFGILIAIGGIVAYSYIMYQHRQRLGLKA